MTFALAALVLLLVAIVSIPSAGADHESSFGCDHDGKNTQCNEFGTIAMDTQREVRGDPIVLNVTTVVRDDHADEGARYVMFSVRHDARGGSSPISLELLKFESPHGPIFTERIEDERPNEINIWAHVADIPENVPIDLQVKVGASDRGAFQVETLVMPFDRGYDGLQDRQGEQVNVFSYTTVGVNKETASVGDKGGSFMDNVRTPGFAAAHALVALAGLLAVAAWRRRG